MRILKITITLLLVSLTFLFGLKTYRIFKISSDLKNEKKNKLKDSAEVLNECFDLKNKNKRTINDSLKLIEYCLEEYGYEK